MTVESLSHLVDAKRVPQLVLKVGSSLLVGKDGEPRRDWLAALAREICDLRAGGQGVIVVSSGAIALGAARLGLEGGGRTSLADAQAAAAVGQIALSGLWAQLLAEHQITAAQLLVTIDDLEDRRRYLNAATTLERLLTAGAVPVINENDSVATEEIRFGDNDRLAARVAQAAGAQALVLLSDVDGLYDRDPTDPQAQLQRRIEGVSDAVRAMASGKSASGMGSGGMVSKLQAAEIAERAGIALAIVNGTHDAPLARALEQDRGTLFVPQRHDGARKAWLGGRQRMAGRLTVDAGCASALRSGNSLLATGITAIDGQFTRGDPVAICDAAGTVLAQGLVEYGHDELTRIMGRRSEEQQDLLGYAPRSAVVHRDHMVLL